MISTHEKFRLVDLGGKNHLFAEVNWNPDDQNTNDCKVVRFLFPDGTQAHVKRERLNEMLFAIGKAEDQQKMIPQKVLDVKWYETTLSVKANKDIRKGEQITFPIKLSMPSEEKSIIDNLKGLVSKANKSPIIKPGI